MPRTKFNIDSKRSLQQQRLQKETKKYLQNAGIYANMQLEDLPDLGPLDLSSKSLMDSIDTEYKSMHTNMSANSQGLPLHGMTDDSLLENRQLPYQGVSTEFGTPSFPALNVWEDAFLKENETDACHNDPWLTSAVRNDEMLNTPPLCEFGHRALNTPPLCEYGHRALTHQTYSNFRGNSGPFTETSSLGSKNFAIGRGQKQNDPKSTDSLRDTVNLNLLSGSISTGGKGTSFESDHLTRIIASELNISGNSGVTKYKSQGQLPTNANGIFGVKKPENQTLPKYDKVYAKNKEPSRGSVSKHFKQNVSVPSHLTAQQNVSFLEKYASGSATVRDDHASIGEVCFKNFSTNASNSSRTFCDASILSGTHVQYRSLEERKSRCIDTTIRNKVRIYNQTRSTSNDREYKVKKSACNAQSKNRTKAQSASVSQRALVPKAKKLNVQSSTSSVNSTGTLGTRFQGPLNTQLSSLPLVNIQGSIIPSLPFNTFPLGLSGVPTYQPLVFSGIRHPLLPVQNANLVDQGPFQQVMLGTPLSFNSALNVGLNGNLAYQLPGTSEYSWPMRPSTNVNYNVNLQQTFNSQPTTFVPVTMPLHLDLSTITNSSSATGIRTYGQNTSARPSTAQVSCVAQNSVKQKEETKTSQKYVERGGQNKANFSIPAANLNSAERQLIPKEDANSKTENTVSSTTSKSDSLHIKCQDISVSSSSCSKDASDLCSHSPIINNNNSGSDSCVYDSVTSQDPIAHESESCSSSNFYDAGTGHTTLSDTDGNASPSSSDVFTDDHVDTSVGVGRCRNISQSLHQCSICAKGYCRKVDLDLHFLTHSYVLPRVDSRTSITEKLHKCESCGLGFCRRSDFHRHKSGDKSLCPETSCAYYKKRKSSGSEDTKPTDSNAKSSSTYKKLRPRKGMVVMDSGTEGQSSSKEERVSSPSVVRNVQKKRGRPRKKEIDLKNIVDYLRNQKGQKREKTQEINAGGSEFKSPKHSVDESDKTKEAQCTKRKRGRPRKDSVDHQLRSMTGNGKNVPLRESMRKTRTVLRSRENLPSCISGNVHKDVRVTKERDVAKHLHNGNVQKKNQQQFQNVCVSTFEPTENIKKELCLVNLMKSIIDNIKFKRAKIKVRKTDKCPVVVRKTLKQCQSIKRMNARRYKNGPKKGKNVFVLRKSFCEPTCNRVQRKLRVVERIWKEGGTGLSSTLF